MVVFKVNVFISGLMQHLFDPITINAVCIISADNLDPEPLSVCV